jgi:predicted ATPase
MNISHVKLTNWRNFLRAEAPLGEVTYVVGANAAGKSNLLDVFRFLRDIAKAEGGGLQKAISDRGGLSKVRCLHARRGEVTIEIEISDKFDDPTPSWKYIISLRSEGTGRQRPVVAREEIYNFDSGKEKCLLKRPTSEDLADPERLTETALEQIQANKEFRVLAELFAGTTYLHLVPQLIKFGHQIGGNQLESDPFGQAFMERISKTSEKTRSSRLKKIQKALASAIPQFEEIRFENDSMGRPHLEAKYTHYRPNGSWQKEDQFSDGTLRLIALFWLLLDGDNLLLLEEPEMSLDEEIVRQFPKMIEKLERSRKKARRQIVISTHSSALLSERGIDARFVLRLFPANEGTGIQAPTTEDRKLIENGFSVAEVILTRAHPKDADQIELSI